MHYFDIVPKHACKLINTDAPIFVNLKAGHRRQQSLAKKLPDFQHQVQNGGDKDIMIETLSMLAELSW